MGAGLFLPLLLLIQVWQLRIINPQLFEIYFRFVCYGLGAFSTGGGLDRESRGGRAEGLGSRDQGAGLGAKGWRITDQSTWLVNTTIVVIGQFASS